MTTGTKYTISLLIGFAFLLSTPVHSQFVTIARKIKSMHTSQADIATVILDAGTFKVYRAMMDTLTSNKKYAISNRDNTKRFVEFTVQTHKVSMQVDSLDKGLSQITVASVHSDNAAKQSTDIAVDAIVRVCHSIGIKCTLPGPKN
ncbi:MAG: hypothetical protein WCK53_16310 [Methanomicrobiales archaeon]